jgi:putative addiction module CopG family antidote
MTITLTPELERIVNAQLATGQFANQEEVIRAALVQFEQQYAALKADIAEAVAQADRGELEPFDPAALLAEAKAARQRKQGAA